MCALVAALWLAAAPAVAEDASDELVQMVLGLIGDQDKDLRAIGLEQVRTAAKGAAATKQFVALLPTLSPDAQVGLLSALADRGDSTATASVRELLATSKAEPVRVAAIQALGVLGDTADVGSLVKLLGAQAAAEKAAARASLIRLKGETTPQQIAVAIGAAEPLVRVALVEILATRRAIDTLPTILELTTGDDASVRAAAMATAAQLAAPHQADGMLPGVLKAEPGKEREAAERCVATVCGRAENPEAAVLIAMEHLDERSYLALLPMLGRVGGPTAYQVIQTVVAKSDPMAHEIGVRALANWPKATIAPRLIELVKSEKNPKCRSMALAALVRVAPLPDKRSDDERLALLQQALSLCQTDEERQAVVKRVRAIRTIEALRFLVPYLADPTHAQLASESVVELAHHRGLREPNKAEFDKALDKVMATSKDPVVVDRAQRYKNGQTWVRPKAEATQ